MGSVLLVQADGTLGEAWAAAISASGHAVLIASGMREAREVVREGGIDVVVIDAHDPRAGVVELAHDINALPDAPPIILISASPAAPAVSVRIRAATLVLAPCEPGEVVTAVGRLLGRVQPPVIADDEPTTPFAPLR